MSNGSHLLPEGFEDFEPFAGWALALQDEPSQKHYTSPYAAVKALYDAAMSPARGEGAEFRMEEALLYLEQYPLGPDGATNHLEGPEDANRLFLILLSAAECAYSVEAYGSEKPRGLVATERFQAGSPRANAL